MAEPDLIERLAREAGLPIAGASGRPGVVPLWDTELRRFAALVAEECCAALEAQNLWNLDDPGETAQAVIRAKFKEPA